MAISQPLATDPQNSPSHSLQHRQMATDPAAPVKSVVIASSGNVGFGVDDPDEQLEMTGRLHLGQTTAPGVTLDKLYNVGGTPYFNGIDLTAGGPYGNTLIVATSGGDYTSIQSAITASGTNDKILIYPGTYTEDLTTKAGGSTTLVGMGTMGSVVIESNTGTALTVPSAMMSMAFIKNIKLKSTATGVNASKLFYGEGTMTTFNNVSFDYNISNGYTEEIIDLEAGSYVFTDCKYDFDSTGTAGGVSNLISASGAVEFQIMQGYGTMSLAGVASGDAIRFITDTSSGKTIVRDLDYTGDAVTASYAGKMGFMYSTNPDNPEVLGCKIVLKTPSGTGTSEGHCYHLDGSSGGNIHSTANRVEVTGFDSNEFAHINATESLTSHFDDIVAVDGVAGDGTYRYVNSPSDGDLQMSGNIIKKLLNITADYDETESWEFGILSANSSTIDIKATLNTTYFADAPSGATKTFVNAGTTKNFILDPNGATWEGSTQERVIYPGGYIIFEKVGGEGIIIASHNTSFNIDIADIDNPSFHVDFSDASSVTTDGSNHITNVVDSVNSWNGTPSSATGVEYGITTQNGLNTALWDTNNTPLSFGDNDIHNNSAGRGMTIIAVVKANNTGDAIMSKYYDATPQREWRFYSSNTTIYNNLDASGQEAVVNYSSNYGEWQVLQIEWVPGEGATAYKNGFLMGTSSYSVATIPAGTANLLMGASDLTGADFSGEIGEIWAFSDTITADEREAVTSKLGAKWDIDVAVPSSSDSSPFGRNDDTDTIKPLIDNDNLDIGTGTLSCGMVTTENEYAGLLQNTVENTSTAAVSVAGATHKVINDNGYWALDGITNSGSTILGGALINTFHHYSQGYADNLYTVDGNKDHVFYSDPTDSHNFSALSNEIMRLSADGSLDVKTNITVGGTVDGIDIATDVAANTAKVTNATHTGEVTGSGVLTLDKTAISNKTIVTVDDTDYVLISDTSDSDNLKKVLASDFGGSGSGDVSKVGTPVDNQVGVWTGDGTIEGTTGLTFDGTNLAITKKLSIGATQTIYDASVDSFTDSLFFGNGGGSLSHTADDEGYYNLGVGADALLANTTGFGNLGVGASALAANTTGTINAALGYAALGSNTTGKENTALGVQALVANTEGDGNLAIGMVALGTNTTGSGNIGIGPYAGYFAGSGTVGNTTSTFSTYIGYFARAGASGNTNETVFGYNVVGNGSNTVTLGNGSVTGTYLQGTTYLAGVEAVDVSSTQTLTNKTIDGDTNTLQDIAVSSLKDGTDGELITWAADGTADTVAVGTSGQILKSSGAGAPPVFRDDESISAVSVDTLTNKRITARVATFTSDATPDVNADNYDAVTITAQAVAITDVNMSGTPTNFQKLMFRIKDNSTARAITWGSDFEAKGKALPTTTVVSKVTTVGFIYDTVTSKWGCVAVAQEA